MKLHNALLLALVLGIALGAALHPYAESPQLAAVSLHVLRPIGQIFLRLIFMIVVPMVFSALVIGVYELGKAHGLSGVAGLTLLFTVLLSGAAVIIGIVAVNVIRPGVGVQVDLSAIATPSAVSGVRGSAAAATSLSDTLINLVPRNPLDSAARALDGEMLPLMVFALIF